MACSAAISSSLLIPINRSLVERGLSVALTSTAQVLLKVANTWQLGELHICFARSIALCFELNPPGHAMVFLLEFFLDWINK